MSYLKCGYGAFGGYAIMQINSGVLYYLEKDGKRFVSEIFVVGKAPEGWSSPDIVEFQYNSTKLTGFLKATEQQGENNAIEIILNRVGKELDVSMADTVGVFSDDSYSDLIAIISISVTTKSSERFVCFREMRDQLFFDYQAGMIPPSDWLRRWISIRERKHNLPADMWEIDAICPQDYADCVMFPVEIMKLYSEKHGLELVNFERDCVKMMLFDVLIGQADRSPSNYGITIDASTNSAHFAPLFDNSTLTKPYIQNNVISFNHLLLDRQQAAKVEFETFRTFSNEFRDNLNKNFETTLEIANSTLPFYDMSTKEFLFERIKEGARIIEAL